MEPIRKKFENMLRTSAWYVDYAIYKALCPFKRKINLNKINRILIIENLYIGDLIVITPTIRALRKRFPKANISLLGVDTMKDVLSGNPNLNEIITFSEKQFIENPELIVERLKNKFDLAVLLHPNPLIGSYKISKILLKSKIPYRIGCTKVGFFEGKGFFLTKKTKPTRELKHKIDDNLDVIKTLGITTNDKHLELYTNKKGKIKNAIVLHAVPRHKTHGWSDAKFAELADRLIKKYKVPVVFSGSKNDAIKNKKIISLMKHKAINLPTNIKDFFALIKESKFVVSVDTSAMHVAAAFNKPIIALFGAGDPRIWSPYCKKSVVLYKNKVCTSCMKHKCFRKGKRFMECMKAISVEDVLNAVKSSK